MSATPRAGVAVGGKAFGGRSRVRDGAAGEARSGGSVVSEWVHREVAAGRRCAQNAGLRLSNLFRGIKTMLLSSETTSVK